jgi:hypothetical protein
MSADYGMKILDKDNLTIFNSNWKVVGFDTVGETAGFQTIKIRITTPQTEPTPNPEPPAWVFGDSDNGIDPFSTQTTKRELLRIPHSLGENVVFQAIFSGTMRSRLKLVARRENYTRYRVYSDGTLISDHSDSPTFTYNSTSTSGESSLGMRDNGTSNLHMAEFTLPDYIANVNDSYGFLADLTGNNNPFSSAIENRYYAEATPTHIIIWEVREFEIFKSRFLYHYEEDIYDPFVDIVNRYDFDHKLRMLTWLDTSGSEIDIQLMFLPYKP